MAEEGYPFQHLARAGDNQRPPPQQQQHQQAAIATRVMPIYRATFDGQFNLMEQQTYNYCNCCGAGQLGGCFCNTTATSGQPSSTQPVAGGQLQALDIAFQTQPPTSNFDIQEPPASQANQQPTISSSGGNNSLHCYTPLDNSQLAPLAQPQHYFSAGKVRLSPAADLDNNNNSHHHHQPFSGQTLFVQQSPANNANCVPTTTAAAAATAPVYHDFSGRPDGLLLSSNAFDSAPAELSLTNETHASSSSLSSRSSAADLTSIHNSLVSESSSSSFTSLNEINCNDLYRFQLTTPEELSQFELTAVSPRRDYRIAQALEQSTLDTSANDNLMPRDAAACDQQYSRRGRPKKIPKRLKNKINGKLWEFIRDLLLDEQTNPTFIRWERQEDGIFKFVQSDKVAKMWGERKQNPKMTYEKLSRAMRYYYKSKVLLPVFGRRLVYKFGPNATGWSANSPTTR